jgi:isopenicillin N synthase-like dioxygenase
MYHANINREAHVSTTSKSPECTATDHSSAILRLGQSLFPLFALALDLPETFFDDKVSFAFPGHTGRLLELIW